MRRRRRRRGRGRGRGRSLCANFMVVEAHFQSVQRMRSLSRDTRSKLTFGDVHRDKVAKFDPMPCGSMSVCIISGYKA